MAGGYFGKILFINLRDQTHRVEELDDKLYRDYLGGYGLAARIYYERMKPGADPLGPENILGFASGIFTGTKAHGAGRFQVIAKSPATGGWGDSNCGGKFAPYLKKTGFDAIFFEDISDKPVYVSVYNGDIKFHDAAHLWGLDACDAELAVREEMGRDYQVATIGQAGESKSAMAGVFNDLGRAAGRMGMGGVMGSKRLKALACGGTFDPPVAHPDDLKDLCKIMSEDAINHHKTSPIAETGTSGVYAHFVGMNDTPFKNWKAAADEGYYTLEDGIALSGDVYLPFRKRKYTCAQCGIACGAVLEVEDRDGNKFETHRPEYETIAAFGSNCLVKDLTSIFEANEACNRYGFDTISAGSTIAWAMECNEHGLFSEEELGGIDLSWGNGKMFKELLRRMALREGFLGDLLCDGMKIASEKLGRGSEAFRTDAGGLELPMHDPRCWPGFCFSYSTDAGPGRHTLGGVGFIEHAFADKELFDSYPELYDLGKTRHNFEMDKGPAQKYISSWFHFFNGMGMCVLAKMGNYKRYAVIDTTRAITGWDDIDLDEALVTGERIQTIRHMFNLREGIRPHAEFRLQDRTLGVPPLPVGPTAGVTCPTDKYFANYYRAMDIDSDSAWPSDAKLEELGIKDLVYAHWQAVPYRG
jgi:aldehyde:ferredoxin oxidoreductase